MGAKKAPKWSPRGSQDGAKKEKKNEVKLREARNAKGGGEGETARSCYEAAGREGETDQERFSFIFPSENDPKRNLSDQEREARYICESFKAFTGVRVLLGAFSVLLAAFWVLLGTFFGALGCLLGALGRLFGASWVLLGRLLGPLDTILQFQSEFCSIWARQRLPKGSQEGAKIHPKSTPNRSKIEFKI